ncbi:MAG: amidohydrolase family protein, partial [Flavobacteriaceae bacterium]|nr:amidohydrolase family protein [Flavobacteriaceae bacterium]
HTTMSPTLIVYHNIYKMLVDDKILSSEQIEMMNPLIRMVDSEQQFERWANTKANDSTIVDRIKKQHEFHLSIINKLNQRGVNIVSSTDAGIGITVPGLSIHQELAFYKEAGLSNYEVLKTATVNASKVHQLMNNMGTIETDKIANLLLVDENPFTNLATLQKPSTVFIKGRALNRNMLNEFENKAKGRKNLMASALRYLEYLLVER